MHDVSGLDVHGLESSALDYATWFKPVVDLPWPDAVRRALQFADECGIAQHRFFEVAAKSPDALRIWVSQELAVTGPFSLELLHLATTLPNVHLRSMLMEVVMGEHSKVVNGCASRSHPWLLNRLRESIGLRWADVHVLPETELFLARLQSWRGHPLAALAALGVGNERLILSEYGAVKSCFDACWRDSDYRSFLDANIHEDLRHSELLAAIGAALIASESDAAAYYDAAVRSVRSRIEFYDGLVERVS